MHGQTGVSVSLGMPTGQGLEHLIPLISPLPCPYWIYTTPKIMHSRFIAISLSVFMSTSLLSAQEQQLLTRVKTVPQAARTWDLKEKTSQPTIARSEFVRVNTPALMSVRTGGSLPLATFGATMFGKSYIVDINKVEVVHGYRCLTGKVRGRQGDSIFVVAPDRTISYSTMHMVEDSFVIVHAADSDVHVVQDLDESKNTKICGCCAPGGAAKYSPKAPVPGGSSGNNSSAGKIAGSGKAEALDTLIDVACFYTNAAAAGAGSIASIEAAIVNAVERANITSVTASTPIDFRLALVSGVNYSQDGTDDLSRFRSTNDGHMDGVHSKRNTYGADLMHLITNYSSQYCGVAYLMNTLSTSFASYAFGVTVRGCMGGNVMTHEMGHNMACHHDKNNAGGALFNHAYGFRTSDSRFRTVMSYSPGSRIDTWSSPGVTHSGYTMGSSTEDNNLTLTKTRGSVSNFRAKKVVEFRRIGGGIAGTKGNPNFKGSGILGSTAVPPKIVLSKYRNNTSGVFVIGLSPLKLPYLGGTLIPNLDVVVPLAGSGADITIDASSLKNVTVSSLWVQALYIDPVAVQGVSATSGFRIIL